MRPRLLPILLIPVLAASAFAHGAVWRPPGGDVTSPGGAGAPTTGGRSGVTGTGTARKGSPDLDRWEAWWYFQREGYLPRHAAGRAATTTSQTGFLTGRGEEPAPADSPLLAADARARVLPVLVAALRDHSTEVVDAAAIALGRSASRELAGALARPLEATLAHAERTPQQAAVLGLGILGGAEAAEILREVVLDSPRGRKLCDSSGPVDDLLRGLAALALGLASERENLPVLGQLARAATTPREIAACAVLAIGLHHGSAPHAAVELVQLLDDESLDREVRAQVPIALHRLPGTRALLPKLLGMFGGRRVPNELARSLAIALGNLALPEEAEIVDALLAAARAHDDTPTRHFSMLALGRLFERGPIDGDSARAERRRAQEWLIAELRDPERHGNRPFAALALGLIGRGDALDPEGGALGALTQFSVRKLVETLDDDRDPSLRGAVAIALGLIGSAESAARLRAELDDASNPTAIGHFATAVALQGAREAIPRLRELLSDRSLHPFVRIDVARALGTLADREFEQQLLALLEQSDDVPQAAAFAKALGLLGGSESVDPLVALAEQKELPEFRRAFAVVALGLLAEKTELPWNAPYLIDANYTTLLRPLQEVFDLL